MAVSAGEWPRGPIPDSYWVRPGSLLAGEYPRTRDEATSLAKIDAILAAGVDAFVDLTTPEDGLAAYTALVGDRALRHPFPIPDLDVIDADSMRLILDEVDTMLVDGRCVYVHCWGGVGRTGTVVGCHLVRHGLSGDEALARIADLRAPTPDGKRPAPETEAQRRMVREWSG
jgi:protein-tyrosine phosphatase